MVQPDLELEEFLGKGSYGSVSLYKTWEPPFYMAVKTSKQKHAVSLYNEFQILSQFKGCSRIVQVYENIMRENLDSNGNVVEYMMLMEYASGGSLKTFMKLFTFTAMFIVILNPEISFVFPGFENKNGTFQKTYELKISDFGLSRRSDGDSSWWSPSHTCVGTPIYMSPEAILYCETGKDLDLWSLGYVVLEMYTGKKPWWHTDYDLKDLMNSRDTLNHRFQMIFLVMQHNLSIFALRVRKMREATH